MICISINYKFKIIKKRYGYVVVNTTLDTHAHLPNYKGCAILLHLIHNESDIKDSYLKKAKERLIPSKPTRYGNKGYRNQAKHYRKSI